MIDKTIEAYNNRTHRGIKMTSNEAWTNPENNNSSLEDEEKYCTLKNSKLITEKHLMKKHKY